MNSIERFVIFGGMTLTAAAIWVSQKDDADLPELPSIHERASDPSFDSSNDSAAKKSDDTQDDQKVLNGIFGSIPRANQPSIETAMDQVIAKIEDENPDLRLDQVKDLPAPVLQEAGTASLFDPSKTEQEIDQLPKSPAESQMMDALGESRPSQLLKRIIMNRRHAGQVPDGAKLESAYLQELSGDIETTVQTLSHALNQLPKTDFREEHVIIREIANQLPEGHQRLQTLNPDEEFQ